FGNLFGRQAVFGEIRMIVVQLVQAEFERVVLCAVVFRLGSFLFRCGLWRRRALGLWRFVLLLLFFLGASFHGLGIEVKPLDGFEGRGVDAHLFHFGNEVERVAA